MYLNPLISIIGIQTVSEIRMGLDAQQESPTESVFKGYVYDGLWTLALAIEQVSQRHQQPDGTTWIPDLNDAESFSEEFLQAVSNTSFIGVTVSPQIINFFEFFEYL